MHQGKASQPKQTVAHLALKANTVVKELTLQMQRFAMQHSMFVQRPHQGLPARRVAIQNLEALLQQVLAVVLVQLEASVLEMDQLIFVKWVTSQLHQALQPVR